MSDIQSLEIVKAHEICEYQGDPKDSQCERPGQGEAVDKVDDTSRQSCASLEDV